MWQKPERLQCGDRIGVFLPASPVKEPYRAKGLQALRQLGFVPVEVPAPIGGRGFLARAPERTLREIAAFFTDRDIKALWAGRGGYGSNLLLEEMDKLSGLTPKVVIGSSDVSYLLWWLLSRRQLVVFYGPMVYGALAEGCFVRDHLLRVLTGDMRPLVVRGRVLRAGRARGIVTGGCLTNFASLVGTPFLPETHERILLLEDVNERPYRLDRLLWQLQQAGVFRGLRGLLLGQFPGCFAAASERRMFVERLRQLLAGTDYPVIGGLPFGHANRASILPLGVEIEIDSSSFHGVRIDDKGVS